MTARILLVDDHALMRAGLRRMLEEIAGMTVVGESGDGAEAVALALSLRPDLVLMDVAMPTLSGLEATERIVRELPRTRVIVLSMHVADQYVAQALRAGASGYIAKSAAIEELEHAVRCVVRGETYLSPAISRRVLDAFVARTGGPGAELTVRQREILRMIAQGKNTKSIAFELGLSVKTIEAHRAQIMERLDIRDVPGLVRYAIEIGLIPPAG